MLQPVYSALTSHEGMYLCYLIPIIYFVFILFKVLSSKQDIQKRPGVGDVIAIIALVLISLDFLYYVYLFFSKTGKLLPSSALFLKYTGGGVLWLWVIGYTYVKHFTRKVSGDQLKARYLNLVWMIVGSIALGIVGAVIS